MPNEELKTFIAKMRTAGKTDLEISAELKIAGWGEATIKQELQSKARLSLGKVKFWIWLYGIAILLFLALFIFPKDSWLGINSWAGISIQIYIFGVVPIATLLALGSKLLFWILRFIPHFKDSKSLKQPDRRWLLVVSTAITGTVMLWIGYLGTKAPNGGMGIIIFILLAFLGGLLLFLSFVVAIILIIVKYFLKNVSKNRLIWVLLISVSTLAAAVLVLRVIISSWYRLSSNLQPTASISNEISVIKLNIKTTITLEKGDLAEQTPMIFVGGDNQLSKLRFDQAQQRYLVEKKIDMDFRGRIESDSSGIYVKNGEKLVKYSLDLERVNEWGGPKELEVGGSRNRPNGYFDYVFYGNYLFVLAGNSLVILDDSLTEVSRLPLEVKKGVVKGAHNIIVYKNMAYLLDNQSRPIYVLKVDLRDVKNPKIVSSTRINDDTPNLELDYQWLDTENLKWIMGVRLVWPDLEKLVITV